MADVDKLIRVLHRLVDGENTVIVIEHNLDVAGTVAGARASVDPRQLAITRAVATITNEARAGLPPSGRRTVTTDAGALLALWRTTTDGLAVWVAGAAPLLDRVEVP